MIYTVDIVLSENSKISNYVQALVSWRLPDDLVIIDDPEYLPTTTTGILLSMKQSVQYYICFNNALDSSDGLYYDQYQSWSPEDNCSYTNVNG